MSQVQYQGLTQQLMADFSTLTQSALALQCQLNSLASVVLQNRRGLKLLTATQGGLCLFLQEECCFYANESGVVQETLTQLQERVHRWWKTLQRTTWWDTLSQWFPWFAPLVSPLLLLLLIVAFGPCILNALTRCITTQIAKIGLQLLLTHYRPLEDENDAL